MFQNKILWTYQENKFVRILLIEKHSFKSSQALLADKVTYLRTYFATILSKICVRMCSFTKQKSPIGHTNINMLKNEKDKCFTDKCFSDGTTTLSITTFRKNDTQHYKHFAIMLCLNAECRIQFIVMVKVFMLNVIILNAGAC